MMGFQSGLTPNIPHTIEEQSQHLAYVIRETLDRGATTVEPTQQAEDAWCAEIDKGSAFQEMQASCTPGYFNDEGKVGESRGLVGWLLPRAAPKRSSPCSGLGARAASSMGLELS